MVTLREYGLTIGDNVRLTWACLKPDSPILNKKQKQKFCGALTVAGTHDSKVTLSNKRREELTISAAYVQKV